MIPFVAPVASRRINRLTCVGDEGRYAFLDWLLGGNTAEQARARCFQQGTQTRDFLLIHGRRPALLDGDAGGLLWARSALVPENIEVFYPFDQRQARLESLLEQVAVFDSFPYRERAVWEIAGLYAEKLPARQITVVLLRGERRFSSTDLQSESQAVREAAERYRELGFAVEEVDRRAFTRAVFHISFLGFDALEQYGRQTEREVREALESLDDQYDLFLRFDLEDLLDQDFYTACESYEVCKGADNLWQRMASNAQSLLFPPVDRLPDPTRHPVYALYMECVRALCFWDIRADLGALHGCLTRLLGEVLADAGARAGRVASPADYIAFMRIQNEHKLHQRLNGALQRFYQQHCKTALTNQARRQLTKLRVKKTRCKG